MKVWVRQLARQLKWRLMAALVIVGGLGGEMSNSFSSEGGGTWVQIIQGVLVDGGVVCPLFRLASGEQVPLMGVTMAAFPVGTSLSLEGVFIKTSPCMQGERTFRVLRLLSPPPKP